MNRANFDSTENGELRAKIDEAKRRLPMPALMTKLGLGEHAKKKAHCPFPGHEDKHTSFSVFQKNDGAWWHKCFVGCSEGDEISFLRKLKRLSATDAMNLYLEMAGFPPSRPHKSHEYPKSRDPRESPKSPESPVYPVHPVSNGQGLDKQEKILKALAARNACTAQNTARKRRWKLFQDVKALEKGIRRELSIGEWMIIFDEWHRLSQPFLDPAKTRDDYLAAFFAEPGKVRVATGEGDKLNKALEAVSKFALHELPVIPGMPNAPESWRRLLALHREMSRLCGNNKYFLSYRGAAKACKELNHQSVYTVTFALDRLGVIKIVHKGKAGLKSRKATEFRYLLPQTENLAPQAKNGSHASTDGEGEDADDCPF
jgi:CHC2 zinc finger